MHASSYLKFEAFLDQCLDGDDSAETKSVLDIGSAAYIGHTTYRTPAEAR